MKSTKSMCATEEEGEGTERGYPLNLSNGVLPNLSLDGETAGSFGNRHACIRRGNCFESTNERNVKLSLLFLASETGKELLLLLPVSTFRRLQ